MGVLTPGQRREWWAPVVAGCFYCGKDIPDIAVYWAGEAGKIVLHPECAAELGRHLLMDSREATLSSGVEPWAKRATSAALASIERKEGFR